MREENARLELRVARLERRNRYLTACCLLLGAVPLMLAFSEPTTTATAPTTSPLAPQPINATPTIDPSQMIKTRKVVIVDETGKSVVVLEGKEGKGRATIHTKGQSVSEITGDGYEHHVWKDSDLVRTTALTRGSLKLQMGTTAEAGNILIRDGGKVRASLKGGELALQDEAGSTDATLRVTKSPFNGSSLILGSVSKGNVRISAGKDGVAGLILAGSDPKMKLSLGASKGGGTIHAISGYIDGGYQVFSFPTPYQAIPDAKTKDVLFTIVPDK